MLEKTCRLAKHCKEISIYVFPEKELHGVSPNFHIYVSVSDQYIPRIGPPIFLQQNRQTDFPFLGIFVSNFRYCVFAGRSRIRISSNNIVQPEFT
jgi:hypothetical protein